MTAIDLRRRVARLETTARHTWAPTDEERAAVAAIEAETGRRWADLSTQEILATDAFRAQERAALERVAAATLPDRRRA